MDTKTEVIEENPLSEDEASQNGSFFTKNVAIKTNTNAVLLDNDCDMTIKLEIKSESPLPDFHLEKIGIDEKTLVPDFGSQRESEFLQEDLLMEVNKYNSDDEMYNKIKIKEEPCWLKTETSSVCHDIKDEDVSVAKFSRSCIEAAFDDGNLPLPGNEYLREDLSVYMGKDSLAHGRSGNSKVQETYVMDNHSVEKKIHSEQSINNSNGEKTYRKTSDLNQKGRIHKVKRVHECEICKRRFNRLSCLKRHHLIHEGKKPHKCDICEKRFTELSNLKSHKLIHEGIKPHQCTVCEKRFTALSNLKKHYLIHEGKKRYMCEVCANRFTCLSHLQTHKLVHDNEKPLRCEICEKRFNRLPSLRRHNLIHEGIKPHKCEICEKRFTEFSNLKKHKLIHEGKKPYGCEVCAKRFTHLSYLTNHKLSHDD